MLADNFNNASIIYDADSGGLETLLIGLVGTSSQNFDRHIVDVIECCDLSFTNHLSYRPFATSSSNIRASGTPVSIWPLSIYNAVVITASSRTTNTANCASSALRDHLPICAAHMIRTRLMRCRVSIGMKGFQLHIHKFCCTDTLTTSISSRAPWQSDRCAAH